MSKESILDYIPDDFPVPSHVMKAGLDTIGIGGSYLQVGYRDLRERNKKMKELREKEIPNFVRRMYDIEVPEENFFLDLETKESISKEEFKAMYDEVAFQEMEQVTFKITQQTDEGEIMWKVAHNRSGSWEFYEKDGRVWMRREIPSRICGLALQAKGNTIDLDNENDDDQEEK